MNSSRLSSENLHASCVASDGRAVLIAGPSGSGKSDLALRLMDRGFTLVSDDRTIIRKEGALYLYDRDSIASGPSQRIAFGKSYLFSNVAYSGSTNMVYATNANGSADGTYIKGVAAFKVNASCRLQLAWQTPLSLSNAVAPSYLRS